MDGRLVVEWKLIDIEKNGEKIRVREGNINEGKIMDIWR